MSDFELDERLFADTIPVGDLPLSRLLLMNDARYPWVILVPRVVGKTEIHHLAEVDRQQLMSESCLVAEFILDNFAVSKMNVGALGNIVSQLHLHHVGRQQNDPAWPGPVWGHSAAQAYTTAQQADMVNLLQQLTRK